MFVLFYNEVKKKKNNKIYRIADFKWVFYSMEHGRQSDTVLEVSQSRELVI